MNKHIFNAEADHFLMAGYGKSEPDESFVPVATDSLGRMILSPDLTIETKANGLNVRSLNMTLDKTSITVSDLDIRTLNGTRDNLKLFRQSYAEATESDVIVAFGERNFLPTNISAYRKNTFYVQNTSGLSVIVTVTLQIAPINNDNYYVNDGSSFSLIGGNTAIFQPSKLMKFARIHVTAVLLANVTVYYFGRT